MLTFLLFACAAQDPVEVVAPPTPAPVADRPATHEPEGMLPPPFAAAEIRGGMPTGARALYEVTDPSGPARMEWLVLASDDDGMTLQSTLHDAAGNAMGSRESRSTWLELESHAYFPKEGTVRTEESLAIPSGTWDTWRYDVTSDTPEGTVLSRFWFAKRKPGAPVQLVNTIGGVEVYRMTLLEWSTP